MGSKDGAHAGPSTGSPGRASSLASFYVQPVCSPRVSNVDDGRYVTRTGVYNVVRPGAPWGLPLAERTLPQALREAGYTTAICGQVAPRRIPARVHATRRGFDHQYGPHVRRFGLLHPHPRGQNPTVSRRQAIAGGGYTTHLIAKEACRLIRAQPADKPLFLYVPFNGVPRRRMKCRRSNKQSFPNLSGNRQTMAAMLAAVDEAIGQIVARPRREGPAEETLIIFSSDNGGPAPDRVSPQYAAPRRQRYDLRRRHPRLRLRDLARPTFLPARPSRNRCTRSIGIPRCSSSPASRSNRSSRPTGLDIWPMLAQGSRSPHDAILLAGTAPSRMAIRMGDWKLCSTPASRSPRRLPQAGTTPRAR